MTEKLFWGKQGEYGPFSQQEDGWPHAGAVVRYYRKKQHMSAQTLAERYSEATGTLITTRWIYKMEWQNKVPTDIARRRILAQILTIPPILFGLASLTEITSSSITKEASSNETAGTPLVLSYTSLDMEWHTREAQLFWRLHYAQTAQDSLVELQEHIRSLEPVQQTAQGNLKRHANELLNSYCRLVATILRDQGNFERAYFFANEGVRQAKEIGNDPSAFHIIAASQYTRGVVQLAWGVFGDQVKRGTIVPQRDKIEAALADFERASKHATSQLKGIICSEMARAKALLGRSPTDIVLASKLLEQAESFVNVESGSDFYTQILLHGDLKGLDKRRLILGRAKTFLALGRSTKALEEFTILDAFNEEPDHTRRKAWTDILYAQTTFALGDYMTATDKAISSFGNCREAHSVTHLARIQELYSRLVTSPYKNDPQVKHLGRLLKKVFP